MNNINNKIYRNNYSHLFTKFGLITEWVNSALLHNVASNQCITDWFDRVERQCRTRGVDNTIQRIKDSKLHVTRYMCGEPLLESINPSVGINRKGLPCWIGLNLQKLADGSIDERRCLLTLLSVSRALPGSQYIPSLSTIEDKPTYNSSMLKKYISYIPAVADSMYLPKGVPQFSEYHITTKSGPNGLAMKTSLNDAHNLTDEMLSDLKVIGGQELVDNIGHVKQLSAAAFNKEGVKTSFTRKLGIVHAPERKSRIIAILDYWTQTALKPFHDRTFKILKSIKEDYTFNQTGVRDKLSSSIYYSLDLSAATDRFPLEFQKAVVAYLTSKEYADSWERLLVGHEFWCPWEERFVRYRTGQPMGAYSSWSTFTLSHHIVVKIAALMTGNFQFIDYAILGDDIVIANKEVAIKYKEIINDLGVSISESKSHCSKTTYEFAKRWYVNGVEITGAQLNAFNSENSKWFEIIAEYKELCVKWKYTNFETEARAIRSLITICFPSLSDRRVEVITDRAIRFLLLPWAREGISTEEQILQFVQHSCASALGCFSSSKSRAVDYYIPMVAEIKARELDRSFINLKGKYDSFFKNASRYIQGYKGFKPRTALFAVPIIKALMDRMGTIRESIESLRDPYLLKAEDLSLKSDSLPTLNVDPERILTTRTSKQFMARNVTLLNNISKWHREHEYIKQNVMNDVWDENEERSKCRSIFRTATIGVVMPGFPL